MALRNAVRGVLDRNLSGDAGEGEGGYDPSHERISLSEPIGTTYGHRLRYALAAGLVQPGDSVVDVGCGVGYGRAIMGLRGGITYTGVDRFDGFEVGAQHGELPDSGFIVADLETWAPPDGLRLDVVVAFEVLEHVNDVTVMLDWLRRARTLVLSVPIGDTGSPWHVRVFAPGEIVGWFAGMREVSRLWQPSESSEIYVFAGPGS